MKNECCFNEFLDMLCSLYYLHMFKRTSVITSRSSRSPSSSRVYVRKLMLISKSSGTLSVFFFKEAW